GLSKSARDGKRHFSGRRVKGGQAGVFPGAVFGRRSALKGRKVAPKYRGPGGETWAGRGARPRWLMALIKQGRKLDEFAIDKALAARKGRTAKKGRRKKK